ncbi:MAG: YraN family protein [Lachnospiraceae bacterium]|nr:YraN family protein [Lachnospiraceae bacterium]
MNKRAVGTTYEQIAGGYLESKGARIIERNYRCRHGEIDLILLDGEILVFVEVKYRKNLAAGNPAEAVDYRKQKRICEIAEYYLYTHRSATNRCIRYDVVAICGDKIEWYQNAFPHMGKSF